MTDTKHQSRSQISSGGRGHEVSTTVNTVVKTFQIITHVRCKNFSASTSTQTRTQVQLAARCLLSVTWHKMLWGKKEARPVFPVGHMALVIAKLTDANCTGLTQLEVSLTADSSAWTAKPCSQKTITVLGSLSSNWPTTEVGRSSDRWSHEFILFGFAHHCRVKEAAAAEERAAHCAQQTFRIIKVCSRAVSACLSWPPALSCHVDTSASDSHYSKRPRDERSPSCCWTRGSNELQEVDHYRDCEVWVGVWRHVVSCRASRHTQMVC